jgi:hypothetical protein
MRPQVSFVSADIASVNSGTGVFTLSSSYKPGDLVFMWTVSTNNDSTFPAESTPSGWARNNNITNSDNEFYSRIQTYYKVLSATDPGGSVTVSNGNFGRGARTFSFRGNRPFRSATVFDSSIVFVNTNPPEVATTTLTSKTGSKPIVAIGTAASASGTQVVTTNLASGDLFPSEPAFYSAYTIFNPNSSLNEVNIDQTDTANFNHNSIQYFTLG